MSSYGGCANTCYSKRTGPRDLIIAVGGGAAALCGGVQHVAGGGGVAPGDERLCEIAGHTVQGGIAAMGAHHAEAKSGCKGMMRVLCVGGWVARDWCGCRGRSPPRRRGFDAGVNRPAQGRVK